RRAAPFRRAVQRRDSPGAGHQAVGRQQSACAGSQAFARIAAKDSRVFRPRKGVTMSSSSDVRGPVELLADEFLLRLKGGEKPTIGEYCAKHPELAEEIRDVFEAVLMVEDLKPGPDEVSGSYGDSVRVDGKRLERVADYRILREIGRGGMGVVYEAEQEALGRRGALKVVPKNLAGDGKALIRFQREAKAAARMHHTNIVPVFDVGQDGEHIFYAMQLIHGQGLDLVINDLKRLRDQSTNAARSANVAENRAAENSIAASLL